MSDESVDQALSAIAEASKEVVEKGYDEKPQQQSEEKQLTEFEQEQQSKGWNPDGRKSAEEWAEGEPLHKELKSSKEEIRLLKRTVDHMKKFMDQQEKIAYDRALDTLKRDRDHAVDAGNTHAVENIDRQVAAMAPLPPPVQEWRDANLDWLEGTSAQDVRMQQFMLASDNALSRKRLDPAEHMRRIQENMEAEFPKYFKKEEDSHPSTQSVESGSGVVGHASRKSFGFRDLTDEHKRIARDFEAVGIMSIDDYIKELVKLGELR